jgi:pectate lyase
MQQGIEIWRYRTVAIVIAAVVALSSIAAQAQLPFFPGAEGFGGNFTGTAPAAGWFSNATVYRVTTTQDYLGPDGKGAPGTLRGAFRENTANKIVVFDVGGTFNLTLDSLDIKNLQNYYIAGQTAPSPVTVYGNTTQITASSNRTNSNVILRYMSFRKGTGEGEDAITFANGGSAAPSTNMIIDHVSATWSEDEVLSVTSFNTNTTVQYSMMTDSLTSGHQYGSLMRPKTDSNVTFHHNLYGNDKSRNPRMGSYDNKKLTLDFVNNVIYNWSERAGYAGGGSDSGPPTEKVDVNWVGNYAIAGPATPVGSASTTAFTKDTAGTNPLELKVYQSLNAIDSNHDAVRDGVDTGWNMFKTHTGGALPDADKVASPFAAPAVTTVAAADAYGQVINHVGNWWWDRDMIDKRIIGNVENNTQPTGGIPALLPVASELAYVTAGAYPAAPTTHPVGYDADNDGMKDEWEAKHGGNLVWNADFDSDGYINLIEFVNELGEFPAPAPIVFNGGLNNRYAHIMNWKTNDGVTAGSNWQPSKYDEAQINSGTVVVDAVGQHAGLLLLGATAASNGKLQVNNGWLEVDSSIVVGAHATGQGTLTLGGGAVTADQVMVGFYGQVEGGGTLTANVLNGGLVSPGTSPGTLTIVGAYDQTETGILAIDLASAGSYDKLIVNGDVQLGGLLEVNLLGGYEPTLGATFDVLDWTGTALGAFELLALPNLVAELAWDTSLLDAQGVLSVIAAPSDTLAGDFNDDGIVDSADYSIWRDNLGSNSPLLNETASLGIVDSEDYDAWKANFGAMAEAGGGGATGAVPEPGGVLLLAIGLLLRGVLRRGR